VLPHSVKLCSHHNQCHQEDSRRGGGERGDAPPAGRKELEMNVDTATSAEVTITSLVVAGRETGQGYLRGTGSNPWKERVPEFTLPIHPSAFYEPAHDLPLDPKNAWQTYSTSGTEVSCELHHTEATSPGFMGHWGPSLDDVQEVV
jgi:hypothetical protein